jgi:DTW domain-containing protein YfiP
VELLILQHPLEVAQAKGSAGLLQLSLQHSRCEVGERFDDAALGAWLAAGSGATWLLYPDSGVAPAQSPARVSGSGAKAAADRPSRLVVLDATWRKSLRMLCLNPRLQALPRLALSGLPPSSYAGLRRAHRADQLSTLEASCRALQQLEPGGGGRYEALLDAFGGFVAEQLARVPAARR